MILVDTSVWIDYFNDIVNIHSKALDIALVEGNAAIGDLIFLEILQGFRSDRDYKNTKTQLLKLDRYEMFGNQLVEPCAKNYRSLRRKGVTVRSTTDVIIATFCIKNNLPLLFKDKDFTPFTKYLGLLSATMET